MCEHTDPQAGPAGPGRDAFPDAVAAIGRFAASLAATETVLLAALAAALAGRPAMAADTAKGNDTAKRTTALAGRTGVAENHIDNVAQATSWNPLNVGGGWNPNSVPCCTQCNSRFASIAQIFDNLDGQLNTRFNSIQNVLENMQSAGLY